MILGHATLPRPTSLAQQCTELTRFVICAGLIGLPNRQLQNLVSTVVTPLPGGRMFAAVTRAAGDTSPRITPDVSPLLRVVILLAPGLVPRFIGFVIMSRMVGAVAGI